MGIAAGVGPSVHRHCVVVDAISGFGHHCVDGRSGHAWRRYCCDDAESTRRFQVSAIGIGLCGFRRAGTAPVCVKGKPLSPLSTGVADCFRTRSPGVDSGARVQFNVRVSGVDVPVSHTTELTYLGRLLDALRWSAPRSRRIPSATRPLSSVCRRAPPTVCSPCSASEGTASAMTVVAFVPALVFRHRHAGA